MLIYVRLWGLPSPLPKQRVQAVRAVGRIQEAIPCLEIEFSEFDPETGRRMEVPSVLRVPEVIDLGRQG